MGEVFGYVRVSTKQQNTDRQLVAIRDYFPEIKEENIFEDKESGKNFEREKYKELKMKLREGDVLIIKSTDRLGRNKSMVKEELAWMKDKGVKLRILSIPTTLRADVVEGADWMMDMITNIIIEVYTSIDEYELGNIKQRQQEGIDEAKKDKGKYPGGQPKKLNKKMFEAAYEAVNKGKPKEDKPEEVKPEEDKDKKRIKKMTIKQAATSLNISRRTLSKRINEYRRFVEVGEGDISRWLK